MNYRVTKKCVHGLSKNAFFIINDIVLVLFPKRLFFPARRETHRCYIDIGMSLQ